jgi:UDP-N-acetylglucosamine 2-epimerase (non-hydrolysing)
MTTPPTVGVAFGTRSEVVKLAPVIRALETAGISTVLFSTGQHRALLDQTLGFFALRPHHDLAVMTDDQTQPALIGRVLEGMSALLHDNPVQLLLVRGDTASALGAAMAAFLNHVPVGHVEAGLRSGDREQPFPEEAYRTQISHLASWHFCSTPGARDNLLEEGIDAKRLFITGNPGVDAVRWAREQLAARPWLGTPFPVPQRPERFVLVTGHRRENFGAPLRAVVQAIKDIAAEREDLHFIWPVHPNPNVKRVVDAELGNLPRIHPVDPLDYPTLLRVLEGCHFVLTDSGTLQEEAAEFGKPVLVLRTVTDRPELAENGGALLVGTDPKRITAAVTRLCDDRTYYARMSGAGNPFGDGSAALRIVRMLERSHFAPA